MSQDRPTSFILEHFSTVALKGKTSGAISGIAWRRWIVQCAVPTPGTFHLVNTSVGEDGERSPPRPKGEPSFALLACSSKTV